MTKSEVDCDLFLVEDLLRDPIKVLENIRRSQKHLIVVGSIERITYNYTFLVNVIVNNLMSDISYFLEEDTFNEVPDDIPYTIAIPSTCIGVFQTTELIDRNYISKACFVGVNLNALPEISIRGSETLTLILQDVLDTTELSATVINITSLHLRGDTYDLNSII